MLPARIESAALEHTTRKTPSSFDAHNHLLRGKYCHHLETPDANREADVHFDRAIERSSDRARPTLRIEGNSIGRRYVGRLSAARIRRESGDVDDHLGVVTIFQPMSTRGDFRTTSFFTVVGPVGQEIILIFSARAFLV